MKDFAVFLRLCEHVWCFFSFAVAVLWIVQEFITAPGPNWKDEDHKKP